MRWLIFLRGIVRTVSRRCGTETPISARNALAISGNSKPCAKTAVRAGICGCSTKKTLKGINAALYVAHCMSILRILRFSLRCLLNLWRHLFQRFSALGAQGLSLFTHKRLFAVRAGTQNSCPTAGTCTIMNDFIIKGIKIGKFATLAGANSNTFLSCRHNGLLFKRHEGEIFKCRLILPFF